MTNSVTVEAIPDQPGKDGAMSGRYGPHQKQPPADGHTATMGSRVRQLRIARQMTQEELAAKLKVRQSVVSDIEHDRYKQPSASIVARIADVLQTTPQYIMFGDGVSSRVAKLDDTEHALLHVMRLLDETDRKRLLGIAKQLLDVPNH